ncbi:hypothetical protein [Gelidibacter gilvus]|uniref:Uncharacterized protein n=1 Tax=Gelidibacter gilvus TaxID=59602 RepID=A0A4Q0XF11_9FLAO|nr:hypothetical protein [Gelidibacter gilvus]RXJ49780.1 hypothetical protein ESZ48_09980 [Gelidibacter gilvus]
MKLRRICIYPKEIQRITGRSERHSRRLLKEIKVHLGKSSNQLVTTGEFAQYTGIDEDLVNEYLQEAT